MRKTKSIAPIIPLEPIAPTMQFTSRGIDTVLPTILPTIFVGIAGYREQELIPTIESIFNRAEHPERVFVGVCEQDLQDKLNATLLKLSLTKVM
jgi:hypothetical protein